MTGRSDMPTIAFALAVMARDTETPDGLASATLQEASDRIAQVHADLTLLAPSISEAAEKASPRAEGRALRAAAHRLVAEVKP